MVCSAAMMLCWWGLTGHEVGGGKGGGSRTQGSGATTAMQRVQDALPQWVSLPLSCNALSAARHADIVTVGHLHTVNHHPITP